MSLPSFGVERRRPLLEKNIKTAGPQGAIYRSLNNSAMCIIYVYPLVVNKIIINSHSNMQHAIYVLGLAVCNNVYLLVVNKIIINSH